MQSQHAVRPRAGVLPIPRERFDRLLLPFLVGSLLLTPVQLYCEWRHKVATGVAQGSCAEFVGTLPWEPNPRLLGSVGTHQN